jgi:ligand-binding sensor domain-containing protein
MKSFYCLIISLSIHLCGYAILPTQFHFRHYNIENGVSSNNISTLFQDQKGYIWIGTENETHFVGPSLEEKDIRKTNLLKELGELNNRKDEIISILLEEEKEESELDILTKAREHYNTVTSARFNF